MKISMRIGTNKNIITTTQEAKTVTGRYHYMIYYMYTYNTHSFRFSNLNVFIFSRAINIFYSVVSFPPHHDIIVWLSCCFIYRCIVSVKWWIHFRNAGIDKGRWCMIYYDDKKYQSILCCIFYSFVYFSWRLISADFIKKNEHDIHRSNLRSGFFWWLFFWYIRTIYQLPTLY